MNKLKKYIPLVIELAVFSICFTLLVYITNEKKLEMNTPKYVSYEILPIPTRLEEEIIDENSQIDKEEKNESEKALKKEEKQEEVKNEQQIEEKDENQHPQVNKTRENYYNNYDISAASVIDSYTATISYYGPDCGGCYSGYTASGYYIGNKNEQNRIYYNDPTYGMLHIVAADKSIPFGTVLNIKINGKNNLSIVLDRGDIGFNRKFQFDMLVYSEAEANQIGVSYNSSIEILRYGY